jgi:hypothetical protein
MMSFKCSVPLKELSFVTLDDVTPVVESYKLPQGLIEKIVESVNCVLELLLIYGLHEPGTPLAKELNKADYSVKYAKAALATTYRMIKFHLHHKRSNSWMVFWKHKINAFFAVWEKEEIAAPPSGMEDDKPKYLFGGVIGQWCRKLIHSGEVDLAFKDKAKTFILSSLMVKKGMPRAGEELCQEAK